MSAKKEIKGIKELKGMKELKDLKDMKYQLFAEIGEQVHYLFRRGEASNIHDDERIKEIVLEVTKIDKEIYKAKPPMYPKTEENKCPSCKSDVASRAVYCSNCGQHINDFYENNVKSCQECENLVDIGSKYCPVCGSGFGGD